MNIPREWTTARLRLRQWVPADLVPFAAMSADPMVMEFFPDVLDRTASDELAQRCQSLITQQGWGFWAIETLQTGEFMGFAGLHRPTAALPFAPCVEIGWRLARPYWGRGFATEAAHEALRIGFEQLQLSDIVSFTSVLNIRSQAVMQRLGMRQDAETFAHPGLSAGHPLQEHCLYRISLEQWAKARVV